MVDLYCHNKLSIIILHCLQFSTGLWLETGNKWEELGLVEALEDKYIVTEDVVKLLLSRLPIELDILSKKTLNGSKNNFNVVFNACGSSDTLSRFTADLRIHLEDQQRSSDLPHHRRLHVF